MQVPETLTTLKLSVADGIATVELDRPAKANAMNLPMWQELRTVFRWIDAHPAVRVAILRGAGKAFCAGIDLEVLANLQAQIADPCAGRMRENLRRLILDLQDTLSTIERCRQPVLAAIHGPCLGGGLDLVCCCDLRYCSREASFSIREIDVGMTADVGTLQRLPKLIGEGIVREMAYTGRDVAGDEAARIGLVNRCYENADELFSEARKLAATIAAKSPLAVRGSKEMITYSRDHSVADGLNYVATWNAAMLISDDLAEAGAAMRVRRQPRYRD